jgi:hypothetical protein
VTGYRLIDLSSYQLIIVCSVQFMESISHVPQQPHVDMFFRPPIRDDEHAHAESSSDESYDSDIHSIQLDAESMQKQSQS